MTFGAGQNRQSNMDQLLNLAPNVDYARSALLVLFGGIGARNFSRATIAHRAGNGGGEDPKIKKRCNMEPGKHSIQEARDDHAEHGAQCQMLERG